MVVSSMSDDDGLAASPSLSDATPPPAVPARAETREMRQTQQATATAPGGVRASSAVMTHVGLALTARAAAEVPEIIVTPCMVTAQAATAVPEITRMTLLATVEAPSGLGGGPMGSRQGHRF